eukprot:scaffold1033_cov171-Amphora_coffeaeformis.AAC.6
MRVSAYVLLAAFATSSPSSAFTPCSLYTAHHQQTNQRTTTSRFAKDEKPSKQGAAKEAAAAGTGLSASKAVPFVAPLAALAAGRQAMTKRDLIRQEQIITEADLARIKKELANTDTAISASFGVAALTSAVALTNLVGVQFNGPKPAPQSPGAVSQRVTETPKKVEAPEPSGSIRKAPLALRTGPVQKEETSPSVYDSLMSRLAVPKVEEKAQEAKAPEIKPEVAKTPEVKKQEPAEAPKAPSFFDSMMQKIEDKKESTRVEEVKRAETASAQVQKKAAEQPKVVVTPELKDTVAEKKEESKAPVVAEEPKKNEASIVENLVDKVMPSKAEEKVEAPAKADSPPVEAKTAEAPKPEVKVEAPKPQEKNVEAPKPVVQAEVPNVEAKKAEEPKPEAPKVEVKKAEEPMPDVKAEAPKAEEAKPEVKVEAKKAEEPSVIEAKKIEEPKVEAPKTEEKKSEVPKVEVKPETPIVDVKKAQEVKPEVKAEPPKAEVKPEVKAVTPVAASQTPQIESSGTAIAVGAGVGVAALGIFAALLAAQDQGGDSSAPTPTQPASGGKAPPTGGKAPSTYLDSLKSTSVQSWGSSSPSDTSYLGSMGGGKRATMKPPSIQRKPPRPENPSSYLGALSSGKVQALSSQTKAQPPKPVKQVESWVSKEEVKKGAPIAASSVGPKKTASDGMMGPLVEEKKQPPRPAPKGSVNGSNTSTNKGIMGPVAYVDALSSNQSSTPESKQAQKPEPWKPRKNGAKKPATGGSYLDSLSGGSSGGMLPSIDELSDKR